MLDGGTNAVAVNVVSFEAITSKDALIALACAVRAAVIFLPVSRSVWIISGKK
jgi:hypothetical protein